MKVVPGQAADRKGDTVELSAIKTKFWLKVSNRSYVNNNYKHNE